MRNAPLSPSNCPVDIAETAEACAMERLSTADALQFAIHCLTCCPCAAAVEQTRRFTAAMKGALREFTVESSAMDWEWSQGSLPSFTPMRLGACAQMRFYVTGYEPPRR